MLYVNERGVNLAASEEGDGGAIVVAEDGVVGGDGDFAICDVDACGEQGLPVHHVGSLLRLVGHGAADFKLRLGYPCLGNMSCTYQNVGREI